MSSREPETSGDWSQYEWIVVVAGIFAFITAYGIGANDVANAFATSVGAKALTLPQAVMIAGIFEFAGAVLLGSSVTDTIRKNVAETADFREDPEVLMYGMMCVIASTGLWLILASYLELPVSTTHSVIGELRSVQKAVSMQLLFLKSATRGEDCSVWSCLWIVLGRSVLFAASVQLLFLESTTRGEDCSVSNSLWMALGLAV